MVLVSGQDVVHNFSTIVRLFVLDEADVRVNTKDSVLAFFLILQTEIVDRQVVD